MKAKVGDHRWYAGYKWRDGEKIPEMEKVEVVRVGRKYAYLMDVSSITGKPYGNEIKADIGATQVVGEWWRNSGRTLYSSPEEYEVEKRRNELWTTFYRAVSRQHTVPEHITTENLQIIIDLIKGTKT